jgi:hypothetical protein
MSKIEKFIDFLNESKKTKTLEDFAKNRLAGATKISDNAKKKGGDALLTYHHFVVKLPYYKKAAAGKFNLEKSVSELKSLHQKLHSLLETFEAKDQIPFQKVMGQIEVVGELIIKHHELHKA